jgi:hypothetical protein
MASLIGAAKQRVGLVTPAINDSVAEALKEIHQRLGADAVVVVVDCDEEVFRLGYGTLQAVRAITQYGLEVRQCSGLRISVLVVDQRAWIFAPTALYVQSEVHSDETPNAIELQASDVERIVWRVMPHQRLAAAESVAAALQEEVRAAEIELGSSPITPDLLTRAATALDIAPPVPFDVARQVRVFQPYIQYVEISLSGCAIQRRRVEIPKSVQRIGAAAEIQRRLRTTFELIERESTVSSKALEGELRQIRDDFTRPLGAPWGRVILRSARAHFDARIEEFRTSLAKHKQQVQANLKDLLDKSREQVIDYYLPLVKQSPPDAIRGRLLFADEGSLRRWLEAELARDFPTPESLLTDMKLDVQFRDVTYETLNEEGFSEALANAYPFVDWKKPFDEFNAAKERKATEGQ